MSGLDLDGIRSRSVVTDSGCWEWSLARSAAGYGVRRSGARVVYVHRLACELAHGEPGGRHALHSCDNPPCCNPAHLRWGSRSDNTQDSLNRGRFNATSRRRGASHHSAKFTEESVANVRARYAAGETLKQIASDYEVHFSSVHAIVTGKTWRTVA